jgi:hypothetical protein
MWRLSWRPGLVSHRIPAFVGSRRVQIPRDSGLFQSLAGIAGKKYLLSPRAGRPEWLERRRKARIHYYTGQVSTRHDDKGNLFIFRGKMAREIL